jgi:hypothetical protein
MKDTVTAAVFSIQLKDMRKKFWDLEHPIDLVEDMRELNLIYEELIKEYKND